MKMQTKILALMASLALTLALAAGCSGQDTSWVAQSGEDTLPVGVYMVELMMGYNDASGQLPGSEDILKETIGEIPAVQYVSDFAKTECAKLLTIRKEFSQRGLTLSEEDQQQAVSYTDYLYNMGESFYNANGVAKESVQYINETTMMSLGLFNNIYGEGGERAVPRADLEKEFSENYTRSQYVYFPKVDLTTGAPLTEEEIAASKEKAEAYLKRAQAGEKLPDLYYEVAQEMDPSGGVEKMADDQYDVYLENNAGYFPPVYESTVIAAADNEVKMVEDDYYFYLIKKLPVLGGSPEQVDTYLDSILQSMKYDEYNEMLTDWSRDLDVRYNNAALAVYTPSKLKMTQEQLAAASSDAAGSDAASASDGSSEFAPDQPASSSAPAESSGSSSQG